MGHPVQRPAHGRCGGVTHHAKTLQNISLDTVENTVRQSLRFRVEFEYSEVCQWCQDREETGDTESNISLGAPLSSLAHAVGCRLFRTLQQRLCPLGKLPFCFEPTANSTPGQVCACAATATVVSSPTREPVSTCCDRCHLPAHDLAFRSPRVGRSCGGSGRVAGKCSSAGHHRWNRDASIRVAGSGVGIGRGSSDSDRRDFVRQECRE